MAEPKKIEREKILVIQVFDPRKIIDGNDNITEVLIQLVEQDIPKEKQNGFYLVPTRVIETLRRYSFEEWDSLIEGKRVRFGNFEPS